jgi:hypothetical protein
MKAVRCPSVIAIAPAGLPPAGCRRLSFWRIDPCAIIVWQALPDAGRDGG